MNEVEVRQVLEEHGAILRGHFRLSSGRHSDLFVQKFRVLEHPHLAQRFGEEIARSFPESFDLVACPAIGAIVLGFATALAAGTAFVFAERVEGRLELRRGFSVRPQQKVLVIEDVITTGGSAAEVVELVTDAGGEPVGIGALIDREDPARVRGLGVPVRALLHLQIESWEEHACPLCARDVALDDPGSRRLRT